MIQYIRTDRLKMNIHIRIGIPENADSLFCKIRIPYTIFFNSIIFIML